jgi:hypothetical protein
VTELPDPDPSTQVWTTGQNYPGYLPDPDSVRVFATQEQARADVAARIDEWAEAALDDEMAMADVTYSTAEEFDNDSERSSVGATAQAEAVRHNADLDYAQSFSVQVDNGSHQPPVFWAQPTTVGEYFGPDSSGPEYDDLVGEIHDARVQQAVHHFATADPEDLGRLDLSADRFHPKVDAMRLNTEQYRQMATPPAMPRITGIVQ